MENFTAIEEKTRVFVQDQHGVFNHFLEFLNDFLDKEIDFYSKNSVSYASDFVLYAQDRISQAQPFQPNIAFIFQIENKEELDFFSSKMTSGGALVLPETEDRLEPSHFFRIITYPVQDFKSEKEANLDTELGHLDLSHLPLILSQHVYGLQKMAQQIGAMEDDFYEVILAYRY